MNHHVARTEPRKVLKDVVAEAPQVHHDRLHAIKGNDTTALSQKQADGCGEHLGDLGSDRAFSVNRD